MPCPCQQSLNSVQTQNKDQLVQNPQVVSQTRTLSKDTTAWIMVGVMVIISAIVVYHLYIKK